MFIFADKTAGNVKIASNILSLTALVTLAFLLSSCGKGEVPSDENTQDNTTETPADNTDEEVTDVEYAGGEITVKARIEDAMSTKVSYTSSGSVWNGGDRIAVLCVDKEGVIYKKIQFSSIQDGSEISFHGVIPAGFKLADYAIYPYSAKHFAGTIDGEFNLGIYTGGISSKDVGDGPVHMVGVKDQNGTFVFHHSAGAIRLNLKNMPSGEITVTLNANETVTGIFGVNLKSLHMQSDNCQSSSTSYSVKAYADYHGDAQVVFPLPEGTYTGISFNILDSEGSEVMEEEYPDPISISVGKFNDLFMELVIDTSADFSRWMRKDTTFVNYIETVDLAQQGQLQNGCDTLFYMFDSKALYGYISVPITTASLQAQLRELHVYIDHNDDQTTEFNPSYDLGWLDLNGKYNCNGVELNGRYDLRFDGSIYKSGRIRKIEDSPVTLHKICPTEQPTESFGWMGGVNKGNSTTEKFEAGYPGYIGSGVLDENNRFRYQFELQRDAALITDNDLKGYTMSGQVTGIVTVLVVVSDPSYGHSSICPDRGGAFLKMLEK